MNITFNINLSAETKSLFNTLIKIGERIVATNAENKVILDGVKDTLNSVSTNVDALIAKAQTADNTDPTLEADINDIQTSTQALKDKVDAAVAAVNPPA